MRLYRLDDSGRRTRKVRRLLVVLTLSTAWLLRSWLRQWPIVGSPDYHWNDTSQQKQQSCRSSVYRNGDFSSNRTATTSSGGILLFYHVSKTGGTTLRRHVAALEHVHYDLVKTRKLPTKQVEAVLQGRFRNQTLFLEFHGDVPGLAELSTTINDWRRRAEQARIPFLAFTVLRDPVSLHVSAYTFFQKKPSRRKELMRSGRAKRTKDVEASYREQELLETAVPNRQCRALYHGQGRARDKALPAVSINDCHQVYETLCRDWDWVGTTRLLNSTTIPLLHRFLGRPLEEMVPIQSANVQNQSMSVSNHTRQRIEALSSLDLELYKAFRELESTG